MNFQRTLTLLGLLCLAGSLPAADYPRGELLVEPEPLAQKTLHAEVDDLVLLDARDRASYEEAHVPGARWVDHAEWSKAFGEGDDAEGWSERIGALGIGPESTVVIYDDSRTKDAARIWWLLRYWGVEDARLLNGGWVGWQAAGHPVERSEAIPTSAEFTATARPERLARKDQLLASLPGATLQVVDARSEDEFCGIEPLRNERAGAIPGAKHLEWSDLTDESTHRFKSAVELQELFAQAGIDLSRPTATHCQSGGRAAVMAFGMELMGADAVSNYYASWAEWGNAEETPIVPGQPTER